MQERKLTKRQEKAIETKRTIYRVALDLIKEKNFESISIEEISKKASVSVGTFYYYFGSKDEIYLCLFQEIDKRFALDIQAYEKKESTKDQLLHFFVKLATHTSELGLHINKQLYHGNNRLFTLKNSSTWTKLQEIISQGQDRKELMTDLKEEEILEYLIIISRGIIFDWCIHNGQYSLIDAMHKYMEKTISSIVIK
ncbi:TetR/AcrR family transcriptional regulator [Brevibacillus laterosporus]|nr:TetR/AcrR family transcriptional regulator [Brevibacillus laterosporus]TPG70897.1 TetR/AcrR family transcriptional regulator [Brevibacillus laterosporus]